VMGVDPGSITSSAPEVDVSTRPSADSRFSRGTAPTPSAGRRAKREPIDVPPGTEVVEQ